MKKLVHYCHWGALIIIGWVPNAVNGCLNLSCGLCTSLSSTGNTAQYHCLQPDDREAQPSPILKNVAMVLKITLVRHPLLSEYYLHNHEVATVTNVKEHNFICVLLWTPSIMQIFLKLKF